MKSKKAKNLLLVPFFVLLWIPIIQDNLHIFKGGELKGVFTPPSNITFNFQNWFDGSYVNTKSEYLRSSFGLRPDFVRVYNQLKYWIFKLCENEDIIIGKGNYLYEKDYIDEYFGTNYVGEEKINSNVRDFKELQDTLESRGILLFSVFAPGKGSFYPEYMPDRVVKPMQSRTNYSSYISASKKYGINFLDFRAWFLSMKDTSRYRLFPRSGLHWSLYGDYLAFDSIARYVEAKTGKDLPNLKLDSIQLTTKPRSRDYDAGDVLNLITEFYDDTLAYPCYSSIKEGKEKMASLTIGDSYYWVINDGPAPLVFSEVDFWYYFHDFWSLHGRTANKDNLKTVIGNYQVICVMHTDAYLSLFGSGFVQSTLEQFHCKK